MKISINSVPYIKVFMKQSERLSRRSHSSDLLQALEVPKIRAVILSKQISFFRRVMLVKFPCQRLYSWMLSRYILTSDYCPRMLFGRIMQAGSSPVRAAFPWMCYDRLATLWTRALRTQYNHLSVQKNTTYRGQLRKKLWKCSSGDFNDGYIIICSSAVRGGPLYLYVIMRVLKMF
jgi:hypothetical protein